MAGEENKSGMAARNVRVAVVCAAFATGMVGLAYASVPLYRMFCQITGFGGTPQRAERASTAVSDRKINVRFDANVGPGLSWDVVPVVPLMQLRLGENAIAHYRVTNRSERTVVGTSTFNVTPDQSGAFFNKIECFCFTEQWLEPGETVEMAVSFFVDPALAEDVDGARIRDITLSYTFYPVANPKPRTADSKTESRRGT
jgi:cytochrome c oxidase assembly protein subunit 11